jgi:hypothetical protein
MSIVSGSSSSSSLATSSSHGQRPTIRSSSAPHQPLRSRYTTRVRQRARSVTPSYAELTSRSGGRGRIGEHSRVHARGARGARGARSGGDLRDGIGSHRSES